MNITEKLTTLSLENSINNHGKQNNTECNCYLLQLPNELIVNIISRLNIQDRIKSIKTCSSIRNIANTDKIISYEIQIYKNLLLFRKKFTNQKNEIFNSRINQEFSSWMNLINITDQQQLKDFKILDKICENTVKFKLAHIMTNGLYNFSEIQSCDLTDFIPLGNSNNFNAETFQLNRHSLKIIDQPGKFLITLHSAVFIVMTNGDILNLYNTPPNNYNIYEITGTLIAQDFIIIVSYENTMFFKNINGEYKNVTPNINKLYSQENLVLTLNDKKNQCQFLVKRKQKLYIYQEQQPTDTENITAENLWEIVEIHHDDEIYTVKAIKNNLIITSGTCSQSKCTEVNIYEYTKHIEKIPLGKNKFLSQVESSPETNCFAIGIIDASNNKDTSRNCVLTVYKLNDNNEISEVLQTKKFDRYFLFEYSQTGKFLSMISQAHSSIYTFNSNINIDTELIINTARSSYPYLPNFNPSNSLCCYNIDTDKLLIHNLEDNSKIIVNCEGIAKHEKEFSPNSQLLAVIEINPLLGKFDPYRKIIRVYRISKQLDDSIQLLPAAELIAEYKDESPMNDFKFHPNGFSLIICAGSKIKILQLV